MAKYFAYVDGLKGPEPQIWFEVCDAQGRLKPHLLIRKLEAWDKMVIDELKRAYPIEAKS